MDAEVVHVVIDVQLPGVPLIGTLRIFARLIAELHSSGLLLVNFSCGVMVPNRDFTRLVLRRQLGNDVFVMGDTILIFRPMHVRELEVFVIAYSRLSEVGH